MDSTSSDESTSEHPYVPLLTEEESWRSKCRKMEQRYKIVYAQKVSRKHWEWETRPLGMGHTAIGLVGHGHWEWDTRPLG